MACKTDNFKFDPDKTAIQNFFSLIYRTNRVKLSESDVTLDLPVALGEPDEHGDNTTIVIKAIPGRRLRGEKEIYYARADIATHYPVFEVDIAELEEQGIEDKAALVHYLDGKFNLVDGEFDIDLDDPIGSLMAYTQLEMTANELSLIYIGKKTIHVIWSKGLRRITDEGRIRVTDDGEFRVVELP